MADGSTCVQDERDHSSASATCYGVLPLAEVHRYSGTADLEAARRGRLARGRLLATCDAQGRYLSLGGPLEGAVPGQPGASQYPRRYESTAPVPYLGQWWFWLGENPNVVTGDNRCEDQ